MALARPKEIKSRGEITTVDYIENRTDLSALNLDELIDCYQDIDQQAQLMKGLILLEARSRFLSNNDFGDWVQSVPSLCGDGNQIRNRYMNFARYFKDKDRAGISLTVAYEISAPVNANVADQIYTEALNKNLSVSEIRQRIKTAKGLPNDETQLESCSAEPEIMPEDTNDNDVRIQVLANVEGIRIDHAIMLLQDCIKVLRAKK